MDAIVEGMGGVPWIRFHEYFATVSSLDEKKKPNGTAMCHSLGKQMCPQAHRLNQNKRFIFTIVIIIKITYTHTIYFNIELNGMIC